MSSVPNNKVVDLARIKASCANCSLAELCLPYGLETADLERLEGIIRRDRPISRGEHLFHVGDNFYALYAVRSGSVKTYVPTESGEEQVLGFNLPGELLGFDAIETERHTCAAIALESTTVCELPFGELLDLCSSIPGLQHQLNRFIGRVITKDHWTLLLLGKKSAEERMAAFLVSLSSRFKQRGFSASEFHLSMSRHDISDYLGLAVETVSRLFARFQDEGLITVDKRFVHIHDLGRLRAIIGESGESGAPRDMGS